MGTRPLGNTSVALRELTGQPKPQQKVPSAAYNTLLADQVSLPPISTCLVQVAHRPVFRIPRHTAFKVLLWGKACLSQLRYVTTHFICTFVSFV